MQTLSDTHYRKASKIAKKRGLKGVQQLLRVVAIPEWLHDLKRGKNAVGRGKRKR